MIGICKSERPEQRGLVSVGPWLSDEGVNELVVLADEKRVECLPRIAVGFHHANDGTV